MPSDSEVCLKHGELDYKVTEILRLITELSANDKHNVSLQNDFDKRLDRQDIRITRIEDLLLEREKSRKQIKIGLLIGLPAIIITCISTTIAVIKALT